MFCPDSRTEYLEGVAQRPDCNVKLIAELPETPAPEFADYVEVVATFNPVGIATIE